MLPVLALVGRPNVGKSTLFNYLTRSRDALVADYPGLTRDRQYGFGQRGERPYIVVDTGGITGESDIIDDQIRNQVNKAIEEADAVLFMVDGVDGVRTYDESMADDMRRLRKKVYLVVNKTEGLNKAVAGAEFHALGLGQPHAVSAAHGEGVQNFINMVLAELPDPEDEEEPEEAPDRGIKVAVIGRPNAGKSTLINRMLGEERVVASEVAGTTRDSIYVPFERDGQQYTLIDTAGVRRRTRIDLDIEKYSVTKALQAVDEANVVIAVLDAHTEIAEQDARLMGLVVERGRALVVAVNKWDGLQQDERDWIKHQLEIKLPFATFAKLHFISALHGTAVGDLYGSIRDAYKSALTKIRTPELTKHLEISTATHPPPMVGGRRVKLRYAHQGGSNPPRIVIHGSRTDKLPNSYKRYLQNYFRETFNLWGTPVALEFRDGDNPYEGKKTTGAISERQAKRAHRQRRFARKKARQNKNK